MQIAERDTDSGNQHKRKKGVVTLIILCNIAFISFGYVILLFLVRERDMGYIIKSCYKLGL